MTAMPAAPVDQRRDAEADGADLGRRPRRATSSTAATTASSTRHPVAARGDAVRAVVDVQVRVDGAGQELRATEVDADHAGRRHVRHHTRARAGRRPARRPDARPTSRPPTRKYRARPRSCPAARSAGDGLHACASARRAARRTGGPGQPAGAAEPAPLPPWRRGPAAADRAGRVAQWVALAIAGWIALSLVALPVSAQIHQKDVGAALDARRRGFPLTPRTTILVLGSDARAPRDARSPARRRRPSRSDSILLMRVGGGHNAKLSIPRDTVVDIPGHGRNKINAAYAFGGAALAVQTVKEYLGIHDQPRRRGRASRTSRS